MKTLDYEVNRIRNELTDVGCRMMFGMSYFELVEQIYNEIIEKCGTAGMEDRHG